MSPTGKISAETFEGAIKALMALPKTRREDDHRSAPRTGFVGSATIIPCSRSSDRKPMTVSVRDISPMGIGIIHRQPMSVGEQFILYLPAAEGDAKAIRCSVTRWHPMGEGKFSIGAVFDQTVSTAAMQAPGSLNALTAEEKLLVRELEKRLEQLDR